MQQRFCLVLGFFLAGVLAGCAAPVTQRIKVDDVAAEIEAKKQREIALQSIVEDETRLYNVAYRIFSKASSLCADKQRYSMGMITRNKFAFGNDMQEAAATLYGLSDVIKVFHVVPDSPAQKAGIKPGDMPLAVNEWPVPVGEESGKKYKEKMAEILKAGNKVSLRFLRDGAQQTMEIAPEKYCDYEVHLLTKNYGPARPDDINAFADGKRLVITRGMMRFTKDDIELATVVAHELAHNAMKHIDKRQGNVILGTILDILIGAKTGVDTGGMFGNLAGLAYSQDFEAEADYVGLYMMALAGMEIASAPNFWRRMAAAHPDSIRNNHLATHPATPHRFLALEETVKEIKQKIVSGAALVPEMKKAATPKSQ